MTRQLWSDLDTTYKLTVRLQDDPSIRSHPCGQEMQFEIDNNKNKPVGEEATAVKDLVRHVKPLQQFRFAF